MDLKKTAWREAATGGLILGLVLVVVAVLEYYLRLDASKSWITGAVNFAAMVGISYGYGRRMADIYGDAGFTYVQGIVFILKIMFFAGILAGLGQFIMQNYVDPEYYREMIEVTLANQGFSDDMVEKTMEGMWALENPVLMIFSGIFGMMVYGGFIGVVVAIFVKRPPKPVMWQNDSGSICDTGNFDNQGTEGN